MIEMTLLLIALILHPFLVIGGILIILGMIFGFIQLVIDEWHRNNRADQQRQREAERTKTK